MKKSRKSSAPALYAVSKMPKRGFLEVLKDPPSPIRDMSYHPTRRCSSAVITWSLLGFFVTSVIAILVPEPASAVFMVPSALLLLVSGLFTIAASDSAQKKDVIQGLDKAAQAVAAGDTDVSVAEYIDEEIMYADVDGETCRIDRGVYLDSLTHQQKKWLAKQWEKSLRTALTQSASETPKENVFQEIDDLLGVENAQQVAYHRSALAELESSRAVLSDKERFDAELSQKL